MRCSKLLVIMAVLAATTLVACGDMGDVGYTGDGGIEEPGVRTTASTSSCLTTAKYTRGRCIGMMHHQCIFWIQNRRYDICYRVNGLSYKQQCDADYNAAKKNCAANRSRLTSYMGYITGNFKSTPLHYETMVGARKMWKRLWVRYLRHSPGKTSFAKKPIYQCEFTQSGYGGVGATDFISFSKTCEGRKTYYGKRPTAILLGYSWDKGTSGTQPMYRCRGKAKNWIDYFVSLKSNCDGKGTREKLIAYVKK